ncbi:MAG: hypothetical protein ABSF50_20725 [Burkholderiaceae bacterium]|jgi:hypothetical protein
MRKIPLVLWLLHLGLFSMLLSSCGGGSNHTPTANQSVGGIWRGPVTTTSGVTVDGVALVTEDGRFFFEAQNENTGCADVGQGNLAADGTTVSGTEDTAIVTFTTVPNVPTNCTYADGSNSGTGTLSGTIVQRSALTVSDKFKTANGTTVSEGAFTLSYDDLYSEPSDLSKLTGTWTSSAGVQTTISSTGATFAQDTIAGCTQSGQISIINSNFNAYAMSAKYSNCLGSASVLNGLTATGIFTVNDHVTPNIIVGGTSLTLPSGEVEIVVGDATLVSRTTFTPPPSVPLGAALAYRAANGLSAIMNISGGLNGVNVLGSGALTETSAVASTFNGSPALAETVTNDGTVNSAGTLLSLNSTAVAYSDASYDALGVTNFQEYDVAPSPIVSPATVSVGDGGVLGSFNRFTDPTQTVSLGTIQVSYLVVPDPLSSSDLIVEQIELYFDTTNTLVEVAQTSYKITTAGVPSLSSLSVLTGKSELLYTAQ